MEVKPNFSETSREDYILVQRALKNDQRAYAELMTRYTKPIRFMIFKMVRHEEDANDLTVEVFAKAFESLHKYEADYTFSTWLYKIATHHCIDFMRTRDIKKIPIDDSYNMQDEDDPEPGFISQILDPEENMIFQQKRKLMRVIVDQLPDTYRPLVILRYFEERSIEEIAQELNLPLGTVKGHLSRAKALLFRIIDRVKEKI